MNLLVGYGTLIICLLLTSCSNFIYNPRNSPCSLKPALYSTTTAIALWKGPHVAVIQSDAETRLGGRVDSVLQMPNPAPYYDYKVVRFKANRAACPDTFKQPDYSKSIYATSKTPYMPGTVMFTAEGLAIDETEIPNIEWQQYVRAQVAEGTALASLLPIAEYLPVPDYYVNSFYAYYPVVGITYEQAKQFCQWRTHVVNEQFSRTKDLANVVCEYRLPTEAEWEDAAAKNSGLPYGTACPILPVQVVEGAAAYLQKRANISATIPQMKADIIAYNKQNPSRSWINYAQPEPYFLRLVIPVYVYQSPVNYFGLYQMLGNVAEMIEEPGVTKGGSYRDSLEACSIKARGSYSGPSATIGFRAVCTVRRLN